MADEESKHNVLLVGIARIPTGLDGAAEILARHFQIPVAAGRRLVERLPAIVKRNVSEEDARMLQGALRGLGFDVTVVPTRASITGQFDAAPASSARLRTTRPRSTGSYAVATGSHAAVSDSGGSSAVESGSRGAVGESGSRLAVSDSGLEPRAQVSGSQRVVLSSGSVPAVDASPMPFAAAQPARTTAPHPTVDAMLAGATGGDSNPEHTRLAVAPPVTDVDAGEPDGIEKIELRSTGSDRPLAAMGAERTPMSEASVSAAAAVEAPEPAAAAPNPVPPEPHHDAHAFDERPPTGTMRASVLEELAAIETGAVPGQEDALSMSTIFGQIRGMADSSIGLESGPPTPFVAAAQASSPAPAPEAPSDDVARSDMMSDLEESLREVANTYVPTQAMSSVTPRGPLSQRIVVGEAGVHPATGRASQARMTGSMAAVPARPAPSGNTALKLALGVVALLGLLIAVGLVVLNRRGAAGNDRFAQASNYMEWRYAYASSPAWYVGCALEVPDRWACRYSPEFYTARFRGLDPGLAALASERCIGTLEVAVSSVETRIDCELAHQRAGRERRSWLDFAEVETCTAPREQLASGASTTCTVARAATIEHDTDDQPGRPVREDSTSTWRFERSRTVPTAAGYFSDAREYSVSVAGTAPRVIVLDGATGLPLADTPAGRTAEVSIAAIRGPGRHEGQSRWDAGE